MESTKNCNDINESPVSSSLMNYTLLSELFIYPVDEQYKQKVHDIYTYLQTALPEAAEALQRFAAYTSSASVTGIQELFLRSFEVQAITTLDIGFVLFGEDYKRGKLLAHLNEEHKKAGNSCHTELADHLPNLLRLLPKMKDEELQKEIATLLLLPAVEKMISEFTIEKIEKKDVVYKKHQKVILEYSQNYRTIYQSCLQALILALEKDFGFESESDKTEAGAATGLSDPNNPASSKEETVIKDFSLNIETEMLTEK